MRLAYLTTQYPKVSHTFIRRELRALEQRGHHVLRLAIRPPDTPPVDPADHDEMTRTIHCVTQPTHRILAATFRTLLTRPTATLSAMILTLRMGYRSERGLLRHLAYFAEAAFFLQVLRRHDVQHVHVHFGTNAATVACLIKRLKGPGYSFTVHGPAEFDAPRSLRISRKQADARFVVAITDYCAAQLRRWSEPDQWNKIHVVRCGLSDGFFETPPPIDERTRTLVCVGRLCEQKGQLLLIRAFASLADSHPDAKLILAGDGPMRAAIEDMIQRLQLAGRIEITGWVSEQQVRRLLADARALILPSFAEGLPIVIMEAMALGRPVITTYVAGIPELVIHRKTGWLIPAGNTAALVHAMRKVLQAPVHTLQAMGARGRNRVMRYHDLHRQAARLDALFHRYARNGRRTAGTKTKRPQPEGSPR